MRLWRKLKQVFSKCRRRNDPYSSWLEVRFAFRVDWHQPVKPLEEVPDRMLRCLHTGRCRNPPVRVDCDFRFLKRVYQ